MAGAGPIPPAHDQPPTSPSSPEVTLLLGRIARGEAAGEALIPLVYEELKRMARGQMSREGSGAKGTLQPTALVHEAYLKLVGDGGEKGAAWDSRGHFFASAARAMRQVLVDRARLRASAKRGGPAQGRRRVELSDGALAEEPEPAEVLAVDAAVAVLEARDPRKAEVVMLRHYAGLTIEETAAALGVSPATVKNEWAYARAWLRRELVKSGSAGEDGE